jgi:hypothetical protein
MRCRIDLAATPNAPYLPPKGRRAARPRVRQHPIRDAGSVDATTYQEERNRLDKPSQPPGRGGTANMMVMTHVCGIAPRKF